MGDPPKKFLLRRSDHLLHSMHYAIFLEIGSCLGNWADLKMEYPPKFESESPCSLYPHCMTWQFDGIPSYTIVYPSFRQNPEWHPCKCTVFLWSLCIFANGWNYKLWPGCLPWGHLGNVAKVPGSVPAFALLLGDWDRPGNVNWSNSCWFMMEKPTNVGDMGISAVFLSTRQELRAPWALSLDEFTWSLNGWKSGVQLEPVISIECHPIEASVTDTLRRDQTLSNLIWRVKKSHISAGFEISHAFRAWQGTLPALALGRMILGTLRMGQTREPSKWMFQWWIYSLSADTWIIFSHASYS